MRAASLTRSAHDSVRRRSAASRSPGPSSTRSPGTSSAAGSSRTRPPRRTRTTGAVIALSAAIACSARYSWTKPSRPLRTTMARMTTVSLRSPSAAATTAATSSTTIIVLANCSASSRQVGLRPCSTSTFSPNWASRPAASASERPATGSVPRSAATRAGRQRPGAFGPDPAWHGRLAGGWSHQLYPRAWCSRTARELGPSQSRSDDPGREGPTGLVRTWPLVPRGGAGRACRPYWNPGGPREAELERVYPDGTKRCSHGRLRAHPGRGRRVGCERARQPRWRDGWPPTWTPN